jgi:hypothetical protein
MLKTALPFVDLRGKTHVDLLRAYPDKAHAIIRASRRTYGIWSDVASRALLPVADWRSHAWLKRHKNPFLHEIESCADVLRTSGVYALNIAYEWGCTSGVYRTDETVTLLRVLDWPFPELGKHTVIALQSSKAGDFYNVTWPGLVGVFNAMAPGRFSAAINQAPMRKQHLGFAGDWIKNRTIVRAENGIPPAHLLRQVFEQANNYQEAREMLCKTPVALPVIFILAGTRAGEACVIERLERAFEVRDLQAEPHVNASNHFTSHFSGVGPGWWPREIDSFGRYRQSAQVAGHDLLEVTNFDWLRPPMLNANTRLCLIADASAKRLMVQGFEGSATVTELFDLPKVTNDTTEVLTF